MESKRIVLNYRRNDTTYYGTLSVSHDDGHTSVASFNDKTIAQMIREVHLALKANPHYTVVFSRGEARHFREYIVEESLRDLIREDPVAAIRELSPTPAVMYLRTRQKMAAQDLRKVDTLNSPEPSTVPAGSGLIRTGYDTIAEAFGEEIYIRKREGLVECPSCGRWQGTIRHYSPISVDMYCPCQFLLPGKIIEREGKTRGWFIVRTQALLSSCQERYFLPREWNPSEAWIKHEDLLKMFESYMKEKMEACSAINAAQ